MTTIRASTESQPSSQPSIESNVPLRERIDSSWVEYVAAVFMVLSVILFLVILVPWTLRFFLFPDRRVTAAG